MKPIYLIAFLLFFQLSKAQTIADTKDFIVEQVKANPPLSNYKSTVFFEDDVLKSDAEKIAGKTLSNAEFDNIFIFIYDVFTNSGDIYLFTKGFIIDIRDIIKVSTTKVTGKHDLYKISVYIGNRFYAKEYNDSDSGGATREYIDKMEISIANSSETAQKIKKAIIYLGKTHGIIVKDGDLF